MSEAALHRPALSAPPIRLVGGLALLLLAASAIWLFQGLSSGNRGFILQLRAVKLGAMITVGAGIGVSTVLFQTVAGNRVLTPSIMGFDALYVLLQTAMISSLGAVGFSSVPELTKFLCEVALMCLLAMVLFGTLLGHGTRDIGRTILTGVILGFMFRSASQLLGRLIDPNEYAVVQAATVVNFSRADTTLLPIGAALCAAAVLAALKLSPRLDVMALGRDTAVSLGLRFAPMVLSTLGLVAVLVSVSTALVGPMALFGGAAFFGLIVTGITHGLVRSHRHEILLPAAALIAANILVIGQMIFERALGQQTALGVVIEFAGGLFFLYLLLKGRIR
ncbi:iron chelate uptake ABC transporter family permease subunit [Paracoccus sediminicola]|uniref:iron chelate uptake ABC transporter family permease subunit n=1 Tax=Paracoccus sediminicola TaxID=3017783 RepID=UPI0022F12A27|nr:iron chelate uptake ABC transporter family permease subunit [Paracoccus sediminicola]WBU56679.1 iron chelate uptake ABC transporter family permease subunit [Paracoccus sediminicola]